MRFGKYECGAMVEAVPGIDIHGVSARCAIPSRVREHPAFARWLASVSGEAENAGALAEDPGAATLGTQSEWLAALGDAAHRMRNALALLESGAPREELTEWLIPLGDYLLGRYGIGPRDGLPPVPKLESDAGSLVMLLDRMATDLESLGQLCTYMLGKEVALPTSKPKLQERRFIAACAESYRRVFGVLPPKRGWFGNEFMPYVGECLGMEIGHRIVSEVITELSERPAAP